MCHLLLLPLLALPVLWLWPFSVAGPIYGVILSTSLGIYAYTIKAMKQPVRTGKQEMLHSTGQVIEEPHAAALWVRVHDDRWQARSTQPSLHKGDRVRVVGMEGMTLLVAPDSEDQLQRERKAVSNSRLPVS